MQYIPNGWWAPHGWRGPSQNYKLTLEFFMTIYVGIQNISRVRDPYTNCKIGTLEKKAVYKGVGSFISFSHIPPVLA